MYYIYHIIGKKIGVTRNLYNRVTKQQGYSSDEYKVLLASEDIDEISAKEIELQKSYGYKVDRQTYKNLIKSNQKMKINATEQTSTFPCPLSQLESQLMDNLDLNWETSHGKFKLTESMIPWIMANAKTSMFNSSRSYIYNKAFFEAFFNSKHEGEEIEPRDDSTDYFPLIREWAKERGIYDKGNSHTQYIKLMEEAGELAKALLEDNESEAIDAIGDMVVVLTNLAELRGYKIEDCIACAYGVIKNRQGKMINGTFVKESRPSKVL
mgnify:FL=1